MINKTYQSYFFGMQRDMMAHAPDFSSAHEMAIYRAITTSRNVREAIKKINILKDGRIATLTGERIIENLLIQFAVSG